MRYPRSSEPWCTYANSQRTTCRHGLRVPLTLKPLCWLAILFHSQSKWAIVPKGSMGSVGTIGLAITSKEERIAELGIVIGRASWGKGIGTSAAQLVTGYGFSTLGLAEMHAEVLRRNLA